MALVSGPGRGEGIPDSELHSSKHVTYIKNLDTVRARKKMLNVN
jgi:geranylgeranyl transferase type-2 subunit beta